MRCPYRTVLAEGQREDLVTFLDCDVLIGLWLILDTLISRHLRETWGSHVQRTCPGGRGRREPQQTAPPAPSRHPDHRH
ncbi:hypothetical protein GZL_06895 [Streptomyces sp. 769]|nr:hypothetical protein GZL_06895 [Streptomyces sp. 769]